MAAGLVVAAVAAVFSTAGGAIALMRSGAGLRGSAAFAVLFACHGRLLACRCMFRTVLVRNVQYYIILNFNVNLKLFQAM